MIKLLDIIGKGLNAESEPVIHPWAFAAMCAGAAWLLN